MKRGTFFFATVVVSGFVGYFAGHLGAEYYLYARSGVFASKEYPLIDFTVPAVQMLADEKFAVVQLSQEEHLTGIKFTGRIINTTAVDFEAAKFQLHVAGESKEFTINRISSGDSTGFDVYIPDLSASSAKVGQIQYLGGMVYYLAT